MDNSLSILEEYLKNISITELNAQSITSLFTETRYRAGHSFEHILNQSDKIGFVIKGLFYISVPQKNGTLFVKKFIMPNEFLLAVFEPLSESTVDITATCDSVVLEAKYSSVLNMISLYPKTAVLCKKKLEAEYESLCEILSANTTLSAAERYLNFIKLYANIEDKIPQHIIASFLGVTPTHLCRLKAEYRQFIQHNNKNDRKSHHPA